MLDKAKKFYKKHKVLVLSVGGSVVIATAGVLLGKKISGNRSLLTEKALAEGAQTAEYLAKEEEARKFLESIGGKIVNGTCFATKEVAAKFLEEMEANSYQLSIFDPQESAIFICRT